LRTVQDSWVISHVYIRCMYHPRNTFTPKAGPGINEDKSRIVRWSHMSHICMYHPRNTFTPKVGHRDS
jgi:hypothetical protein